jgi:predicted RNase H-like nuclease (RuvC/YqgF family)
MQITCPSCGALANRVYDGIERKTHCENCGWDEVAISTSIIDGLPDDKSLKSCVKWCLDTGKEPFAVWLIAGQEEATVSCLRQFMEEYMDNMRILNEVNHNQDDHIWNLMQDVVKLERTVAQLECDNTLRAMEIAQDRKRISQLEREMASLRRLVLSMSTPEDLVPVHLLRSRRQRNHR